MDPELINRVIGLISENNDRAVLVDPQTGRAVVVMDLRSYERLLAGQNQPQYPSQMAMVQPPSAYAAPIQQLPPQYAPVPLYQPQPQVPVAPQYVPAPSPAFGGTPPFISSEDKGRGRSPAPSPFAKASPAAPSPFAPTGAMGDKPELWGTVSEDKTGDKSVPSASSSDLTQDELLDRINREIGAWKSAQERRRAEELQAVIAPLAERRQAEHGNGSAPSRPPASSPLRQGSGGLRSGEEMMSGPGSRSAAPNRFVRRAASPKPAPVKAASETEDEEKFYLEPIE